MGAWDDYALDELERVMGSETVRHPIHMHKVYGGGEWDCLHALPRDVKRTLTGAQFLTPNGLHPDQAFMLIEQHKNVPDVDAAIEWWVGMCLAAIRQRRRNAHWRRHHRLAVRNGYTSYWHYRKARAIELKEAA